MTRLTQIELYKENFKFSSGHFTIFSATQRENLHGHNFRVGVTLTSSVPAEGLTFDYGIYKKKTEALCSQLNEHFLLPGRSPHLDIEEDQDYFYAHFNGEKIPFLKRDVLILPIANVTLEELSQWFLQHYINDKPASFGIREIEVKVFSGPGQSASANWKES